MIKCINEIVNVYKFKAEQLGVNIYYKIKNFCNENNLLFTHSNYDKD